jgi:hypothetical protein
MEILGDMLKEVDLFFSKVDVGRYASVVEIIQEQLKNHLLSVFTLEHNFQPRNAVVDEEDINTMFSRACVLENRDGVGQVYVVSKRDWENIIKALKEAK